VVERTNARLLSAEQVPSAVEFTTGDLSFISWSAVLPALLDLLTEEARLLLLVKPQFELAAAGESGALDHGVVADMTALRSCLAGLYNLWRGHGLGAVALIPAGLRGARGNQEYFAALARGRAGMSREQYETGLDEALERGQS
jgi:23S rRNA (cytidine1920-2'-O)/16S rRNA (cytidine1409-2'-O)-methyltransferase